MRSVLIAGGNDNQLFLNGQAGIFPGVDAAVEMVNGLEIVLLKVLQGLAAAAAGSAMDQIGFGFVEGVDALLKIGAMEIDVGRTGDVKGFEFLRCSNIEDDEIGLREQSLSAPGVDMLDGRSDGSIGGIGGQKTEREGEREQGSAKSNGSHNFLARN